MPLTVTAAGRPQATAGGTLTSGSPVVTGIADTTALAGAVGVSGTGIPFGALVQSIDSETQLTLNANATTSGTQTLTFNLEPVSLADAKTHLRVTFTDDDGLIARHITAARRACEVIGSITMLNTAFTLVDDSFPFTCATANIQLRQFLGQFSGGSGAVYPGVLAQNYGIITLPRAPVVSVQSINYVDVTGNAQVFASQYYDVTTGSPGRIAPVFGQIWPVTLPRIGAVSITFTAGYGTNAQAVPDNCKAAVLLYLGWLYRNRDTGAPPSDLHLRIEQLLGIEDSSGGYG